MDRRPTKKIAGRLPASLLLSVELLLTADAVFALAGFAPSGKRLLACFALLFLAVFLPKLPGKSRWIAAVLLPVLCALGMLAAFAVWRAYIPRAVYREADQGKAELYGGKKVLLFVPHEDDDQNLLGGVLEEYVRYGSRIRVVFLTAGDFQGSGEGRMREAVEVLGSQGIPEEDVIFLGYGDQWDPAGPHIYNASPDRVLRSHSGFTATYGPPGHPAYHDGNPYTRQNLLDDLCSLILDYEPDVLFACDLDGHSDHMATSLFFEEAMGRVLAEKPDYEPVVLKGFAYSTAFYGVPDFYALDLGSTRKSSPGPYMSETHCYRWEDRVRLPVSAAGLSRSLESAGIYRALEMYRLQSAAKDQAERIINGDKVFWQRDTSSLSYEAEITASSGEAWRLNDFKLCDSDDLTENAFPSDGTWVPEAGDTERRAELTLAESADLCLLRLYDSPSETDNVLDALLVFDDGTQLHTGPLDPMGAATEFRIGKKDVTFFSIQLLETEGEQAGLAEIEVYDREPDSGLRFIKLQNREGDFVYDYYIDRSGTEDFSLYAMGAPEELDGENYTVSLEGEGCRAELLDGKLRVECPAGKSCTVTVRSADGRLADSVRISNPRFFRGWGQALERFWRERVPQLKMMTAWIKCRDLLRTAGL